MPDDWVEWVEQLDDRQLAQYLRSEGYRADADKMLVLITEAVARLLMKKEATHAD